MGLREVRTLLLEFQEMFQAGLLPEKERWSRLKTLGPPWGRLVGETLFDLRSRGAAVLPTIKRLREFAVHLETFTLESRAQAAQAQGQALICAALVPFFGLALYGLLPEVRDAPVMWLFICVGSVLVAATGAFWMIQLADSARWAGLSPSKRKWVLFSLGVGERLLALIRSGLPPDLAWKEVIAFLEAEVPDYARFWPASIWVQNLPDLQASPTLCGRESRAVRLLQAIGEALKKSVHVSLLDGKPCLERIECELDSLRREYRSVVETSLKQLPNQALKPLFICVAPAVMGLLAMGVWFSIRHEANFF